MIIIIILMVVKQGMTDGIATRNTKTTNTDTQTTTECTELYLNPDHKVLCQGNTLDITCPDGTIIIFHDANFGRSSRKPCHDFWGLENGNCNSNTSTLATLRRRCNQTSSCNVYVSKTVFGNPTECFTITKYLDVKYSCQQKVCKDIQMKRLSLEVPLNLSPYPPSDTEDNSQAKDDTKDDVLLNLSPYPPTDTEDESKAKDDTKEEKYVIYISVGSMLVFVTVIVISAYIIRRLRLKPSSRNLLPFPDVGRNNVPATVDIHHVSVTNNEDVIYEEIGELQYSYSTESYGQDGYLHSLQTGTAFEKNIGKHGNGFIEVQRRYINVANSELWLTS